MSLLDTALGNATDADKEEVGKVVAPVLVAGEKISHAFRVGVRDVVVLTSLRLILVDKQGISGKRMQISSHPYKHFRSWSMKYV